MKKIGEGEDHDDEVTVMSAPSRSDSKEICVQFLNEPLNSQHLEIGEIVLKGPVNSLHPSKMSTQYCLICQDEGHETRFGQDLISSVNNHLLTF